METYYQDNREFSHTQDLTQHHPEFLVSGAFGPEEDLQRLAAATGGQFIRPHE